MANSEEATLIRKKTEADAEEITEIEKLPQAALAVFPTEKTITNISLSSPLDFTSKSVDVLLDDDITVDYLPQKNKLNDPATTESALPHSTALLPRHRSKVFLIMASGILVLTVMAGLYFARGNNQHTSTSQPITRDKKTLKNLPKNAARFKLSQLDFLKTDGTPTVPALIKAGETLDLRFYVQPLGVAKLAKKDLTADIRIYSLAGELLVYQHNYVDMAASQSDGKVKILTHITLAKETPTGQYRVMIDVNDSETGRQASLQGRFQVTK